jgi:glycosidase
LAAKSQWGGIGMAVGRPVAAILYGLSRGPIMIYNGQEVGEPGSGIEGFGANDGRTSIFDYWSMPELVKWVNGHKYDGQHLSTEQRELRRFYGRLINLTNEPAFRDGLCIPLNAANKDNPNYGRLANEQPSGHWLYSFLRYDPKTAQKFLVVANLNQATEMKDIRIKLPINAIKSLGLEGQEKRTELTIIDRLAATDPPATKSIVSEATDHGITIAAIPALTACYFELTIAK